MKPRSDALSFGLWLGVWLLVAMATSASSKFISKVGMQTINFHHEPLPDLIHGLSPPSEVVAPLLADLGAAALIVAALAVTALSPRPLRIASWYAYLHAGLLFVRMLSYSVTVLPSPVLDCRSPERYANCALCQDVHDLMPSMTTFYCNDLLFSGHTMTAVVSAAFVVWSPRVPRAGKALAVLLAAAVALALPVARMHYTVDVLLSVTVSTQWLALNAAGVRSSYAAAASKED